MLRAALDRLWERNEQFSLNIYFRPMELSPYMRPHERYTYQQLGEVFETTDLLVVPSIWHETFGYVVLEALSHGVPVVMSGNVGAKDILAEGAGIVVEDITAERLYDALSGITSGRLAKMNAAILERQEISTLRQMAKAIEDKCYRSTREIRGARL